MENKFLVLTKDHRFRIIEIEEQTINIYRAMVDGDALTGDEISRDIEAEKRDIVDKYWIIRSLNESKGEEKESEFTFSDVGPWGDPARMEADKAFLEPVSFIGLTVAPNIIKPFDYLPMHVIEANKDTYRRVHYDDYQVYKAIMMYLDEQRKDPWNPMAIIIRQLVLPVFNLLTHSVIYYRLRKYKRGFDKMLLDSAYQKPITTDYSVICDSPARDVQGSPCYECPMQTPHFPSERNKYICPHFPNVNYKTCKPAVKQK